MRSSERSSTATRAKRWAPRYVLSTVLLVIVVGACVIGGQAYAHVTDALQTISSAREVRPQATAAAPSVAALPSPAPQAQTATTSRPTPTPGTRLVRPSPLLARPFTVLLIGTDIRDRPRETSVRADTLMLVRVAPQARRVALLSIPRDTLVTIPSQVCGGRQKINAAYACGYLHPEQFGADVAPADAGAALAAATVEAFLDVPVDYTAQIDFRGFERLIDAIGGVTIDVPRTIIDPAFPTDDYGTRRLVFRAGRQHMDGPTALAYARTRHADNDFGRIERQQQVVLAALEQFRARGLLDQMRTAPRLLTIVSDSLRTTLPLDDLSTVYELAQLAAAIGPEGVERLALTPQQIGGRSNLRTTADDAIVWQSSYVADVVEQFLGQPAGAGAHPAGE